jgi:hypothetical protein
VDVVRKQESQAFLDQQADACPSVEDTVECSEGSCEETIKIKDVRDTDEWQVPDGPSDDKLLLCPDCADRTCDPTMTPSEAREKHNQKLTEYA